MELGTIFYLEEYEEAYEFIEKNGYTIKEIEPKGDKRRFQIIEIPIYKPTNEEISQQRQNAYTERTDPLTLRKLRKQALNEWTSEDEKEYILQMQNISEQIEKEFPYNSEEPIL